MNSLEHLGYGQSSERNTNADREDFLNGISVHAILK